MANPLQYSCLENPMDREADGYSPWVHKRVRDSFATEHHHHKQQHSSGVTRHLCTYLDPVPKVHFPSGSSPCLWAQFYLSVYAHLFASQFPR